MKKQAAGVLIGASVLLTVGCGNTPDKSQYVHKNTNPADSYSPIDFSEKRNENHNQPLHEWSPSGSDATKIKWMENQPENRPVHFKVSHYDLDIKVYPVTGLIEGRSNVQFTSLVNALTGVSLDAVDMDISKVTSQEGYPLNFQYDGKTLWIELQESLGFDQAGGVIVHYLAGRSQSFFITGPDLTDPDRMRAGFTFTQPNGSQEWFPCLDLPSSKATADISVSVPESYNVLSNGPLLGRQSENGYSTFHYRMEQAIAPYLMSLAVGQFDEVNLGSYQNKPLTLWTPPHIRKAAIKDTLNTKSMMKSFGQFTGVEYPYPLYAQSVSQAWGTSMEHQAATTMGGWRITGDQTGEGVVAHELAHQWFGDWVTCETWSELWLNEGFASYLPVVWFRDSGQMNQSLDYELWHRNGYFSEAKTSAHPLSMQTVDLDSIFDSHAYEKGALVINLMRHLANDMKPASDLDVENFTLALKDYLSTHGGKNVRNADLQKSLETVTGQSWQTFFNQWVRSAGHPRLSMDFEWLDNDKIKINVTQSQTIQEKPWGLFTFPLEIELLGPDGQRLVKTVQIYDQRHSVTIEPGFSILGVATDPEWKLPAEFTYTVDKNNWLHIFKSSPALRSRLQAIKNYLGDLSEPVSPEVMDLIKNDPSLFIQTEALALLSIRRENLEAIRLLLNHIRTNAHKPDFDRSIRQGIALTDAWLTEQHPDIITDRDADIWKYSYLQADTTYDRLSYLRKLKAWSLTGSQEFALERLKESNRVTRDRANLIDLLSKDLTDTSIEFIQKTIEHGSLYWARRVINNVRSSHITDPRLIASLDKAAGENRYDSARIAAIRALSGFEGQQALVCPILTKYSRAGDRSQDSNRQLQQVALDGLSRLQCQSAG